MSYLTGFLEYLEGEKVDIFFVDALVKRAKNTKKIYYRTFLMEEGLCGEGDLVKISDYSICSASSSSLASLKACKSFAADTCKELRGMSFYTCLVQNPYVCVEHDVLLRYLKFFDNMGYTKNIVIPRLTREQESIIVSCTGVVVDINC